MSIHPKGSTLSWGDYDFSCKRREL